ncbi:MAG: DUF2304 domain-containing protein [Clostridia bacterium]|nr:DUF2304 domain-containing protein [Clostridia bacterium]MBR0409153.1 DUF2304 domain-containing protein [Clostridia bacterium]
MGSNTEHKGKRFLSSLLYYIAVLALVVVILFMYAKWRDRQQQYVQLVQEAAAQDVGYAIELQKGRSVQEQPEETKEETVDQPEAGK